MEAKVTELAVSIQEAVEHHKLHLMRQQRAASGPAENTCHLKPIVAVPVMHSS